MLLNSFYITYNSKYAYRDLNYSINLGEIIVEVQDGGGLKKSKTHHFDTLVHVYSKVSFINSNVQSKEDKQN